MLFLCVMDHRLVCVLNPGRNLHQLLQKESRKLVLDLGGGPCINETKVIDEYTNPPFHFLEFRPNKAGCHSEPLDCIHKYDY